MIRVKKGTGYGLLLGLTNTHNTSNDGHATEKIGTSWCLARAVRNKAAPGTMKLHNCLRPRYISASDPSKCPTYLERTFKSFLQGLLVVENAGLESYQ